ncbi:MAG: hypothetical protein JEY97_01290 [Bacteroidales bacterium]|nr:hypothetical protein [Bacteroidales bacterium]
MEIKNNLYWKIQKINIMPKNKYLSIRKIKLDLKNYRTVPQKSEEDAINAMLAIGPDRFYAVVQSIIEDGYLPTENLIILEDGSYIVKEGNRRTAALKLIHGIHQIDGFNLPDSLKKQIENIDQSWLKDNEEIPCSIYTIKQKNKVDKIVNLTHAKGEKASRDPWTSVAKARQNRDEKKASEPALDVLEKYLSHGKNITNQQKERWSGDYPLTVLDEALRKIISRVGHKSIADLAKHYQKTKYRYELEDIMRDVGLKVFGFKEIRSKSTDFAANYNIPIIQNQPTSQPSSSTNQPSTQNTSSSSTNSQNNTTSTTQTPQNQENSNKPKAYAIYDQRTVTQTLKKFIPTGNDRQKLVTLRDEIKKLKVKDNPIAFCFLLRSTFEISANIYCKENSIPIAETKNGKTKQKTLRQLLSAVTTHLTVNNSNQGMVKTLHGANSELSKPTGLLSVTSMNQLVHNPKFSIAPHDIFTLFNNIYPLLEAMN